MFWRSLSNTVKVSRSVQKIVVSAATTALISVALLDFFKERNKRKEKRWPTK